MSSLPIRGILAVLAGFFINVTVGAFYTFGNLMPYIVSYMRNSTDPNITYSDFATVNFVFGIMNGISLALAPLIIMPYVGHRMTVLIGGLFYSVGPLITRFTMEKSLELVILSYGIVQGLGNMVLIPTYIVSMKWFPNNKGAAVGLVVTGYGFSTMIMNPIMLAITNPDNVSPTKVDGIDDQGGHSIDNHEGIFLWLPVPSYFGQNANLHLSQGAEFITCKNSS